MHAESNRRGFLTSGRGGHKLKKSKGTERLSIWRLKKWLEEQVRKKGRDNKKKNIGQGRKRERKTVETLP
jgi:hypothetical protein